MWTLLFAISLSTFILSLNELMITLREKVAGHRRSYDDGGKRGC